MKIKRGDIYLANLDPSVGSEIKKTRPVVVVSNNIANEYSNTVTVVPITSQKLEKVYPFEVLLTPGALPKKSKAKADQVRTIDKTRLIKPLGELTKKNVLLLNTALRIHLSV